MPFLLPGDTILFQGDSITDAGRRDSITETEAGPHDSITETAEGLGSGYVAILAGWFQARHPEARWTVLNRGVGGDRTVELLARWDRDCLALRPDVLSVKVGVNDVWRYRGEWEGQTFVPAEAFERNYRSLLDRARDAGIRRFVLVSPTVIDDDRDRELSALLDDRAATVRALAAEYGAVYVPAREAFLEALRRSPRVRWTLDGCHPTAAGHGLLAAVWAQAVGL